MDRIIKTDAICVKAIEFGEADKIVTVCAMGKGKFSFKAKGCKKANAKLKFAASQMCFGEYLLAEKGNNKTLIGCVPHDTFFDLTSDIEGYFCAAVIIEILNTFVKENQPDDDLILLAVRALGELTYNKSPSKKVILSKFLLDTMLIEGYSVDFSKCCRCGNEITATACLIESEFGFACKNCYDNLNHIPLSIVLAINALKTTSLSEIVTNFDDGVGRAILGIMQAIFSVICEDKLMALSSLLLNF